MQRPQRFQSGMFRPVEKRQAEPRGSLGIALFTKQPNCTGNGPCPYFAMLVATADIGCEGEVTAATCY